MTKEVHGHEILNRIVAAGGTLSLQTLRNDACGAYGPDATYFTCSARGMGFDSLLEFLKQRNKIAVDQGIVRVFVENMCAHSDAHGG
jgi:probable metal-binding protein